MIQPTEGSPRPSSTKTLPMRAVKTACGVMRATCRHPQRVTFSTTAPDAPESPLLINRVQYSCSLLLDRGEVPEEQRSWGREVDDIWRSDSIGYVFRRVDRKGDATDGARRTLNAVILPVLADWLRTDEGRELLDEGTAYWQADCQRRADNAEQLLSAAFQKVQRLRRAVAVGERISAEHEAFLRNPYVEKNP